MLKKTGYLYINLGTPKSLDIKDVREYLTEFLMDPFVVDVPYLLRLLLVRGIIIPRRVKNSREAYSKIWRKEGSPLMIYSQGLVNKLKSRLEPNVPVELAMRYGEPSILSAGQRLVSQGVTDIRVITAYPHYAMSSTETAVVELKKFLKSHPEVDIKIHLHYEADEGFINESVRSIEEAAQDFKPDHYLFSYHGLPLRHLKKISQKCNGNECSMRDTPENKLCYRRQTYRTTEQIVKSLGLEATKYSHAFQSRLTNGWVEPYTDKVIVELAQKGVKKLLVACPSFTADCLETLEEIAIRAREDFIAHGGKDLKLVPAVNDSEGWVDALMQMWGENEEHWQDMATL